MFLLLPMDKSEQNFDDIFASFLLIEFSKTGKGKNSDRTKRNVKKKKFYFIFWSLRLSLIFLLLFYDKK